MTNEPMNLLFICSRNQWRSPTAEAIWRKDPDYRVRSAGTSPRARRTVNEGDIQWADVIFVMESKHRNRVQADFARLLNYKPIYVLEIPDEYRYMDPDLVDELEGKVDGILAALE